MPQRTPAGPRLDVPAHGPESTSVTAAAHRHVRTGRDRPLPAGRIPPQRHNVPYAGQRPRPLQVRWPPITSHRARALIGVTVVYIGGSAGRRRDPLAAVLARGSGRETVPARRDRGRRSADRCLHPRAGTLGCHAAAGRRRAPGARRLRCAGPMAARPHTRALYERAGFAHTGHTEIVCLARAGDLPRPATLPVAGLPVSRSAGMNGTRLSAVLGGDHSVVPITARGDEELTVRGAARQRAGPGSLRLSESHGHRARCRAGAVAGAGARFRRAAGRSRRARR